jgi:hypothetical protein
MNLLQHHTEKALLACDDAYHAAARRRTPFTIKQLERLLNDAINHLTLAQASLQEESCPTATNADTADIPATVSATASTENHASATNNCATSSAPEEASPSDTSSATIAAMQSLLQYSKQEHNSLSLLVSSNRPPSATRIRHIIQSTEAATRYLKSLQALAVDLRKAE